MRCYKIGCVSGYIRNLVKNMDTKTRKSRNSNLELLRIICVLAIIYCHASSQGELFTEIPNDPQWGYFLLTNFDRIACGIFVVIGAWFMCDKQFKIDRVFRTWLTVFTLSVPLMLFSVYYAGIEVSNDAFWSVFFPLTRSPLWFCSFYIILLLLSPILNVIINEISISKQRYIICFFFVFMVLPASISTHYGIMNHELFHFIFLYLLTGYIKKNPVKIFDKQVFNISLFLTMTIVILVIRVVGHLEILGELSDDAVALGESYRSRLQSLPNLLCVFSAFFFFKNLKEIRLPIINFISNLTLGIYVFHQTPIFRDYLWIEVFKNRAHQNDLKYALFVGVAVYFLGFAVEVIRQAIVRLGITDRQYYLRVCSRIDNAYSRVFSYDNSPLQPIQSGDCND